MEPEKSRPSSEPLTCLTSNSSWLSPACETREGKGERGDAVWACVGTMRIRIAGAHGTCGLKDQWLLSRTDTVSSARTVKVPRLATSSGEMVKMVL